MNQVSTRKPAKTAVVVHLYHLDVWAFIAQRLEALQGQWDLHVTLSKATVSQVGDELLDRFPNAYLHIYPNQGMDILPFLRLLPHLAEQGISSFSSCTLQKAARILGKRGVNTQFF